MNGELLIYRSFTDPSQAKTTQSPHRSQRRRYVSAASAALQPYLFPGEGKKPTKAIPDWLFNVPDDTMREIDDITVWGLDVAGSSIISATHPSQVESKTDSTAERRLPPGTQVTPQEFSLSPFRPQAQSTQHRGSQIAGISSLSAPTRPSGDPTGRRMIQLESSQPDSAPSEHGETDEDDMSDYEREKRRVAKGKAKAAAEPQDESPPTPDPSDDPDSPPAHRLIGAAAESLDLSQSLSGSHNSGHEFSLSQFAGLVPALSAAENDRIRQEIASMPTPKKSSPLPQSRQAKRSLPPSENASPSRDAEKIEKQPAKRSKAALPNISGSQSIPVDAGKRSPSVLSSLRSAIGLAQAPPSARHAASSPDPPPLASTEDKRSFLGKIVDWGLGRSSQAPEEPSAPSDLPSHGEHSRRGSSSSISASLAESPVFGRPRAKKVVGRYQTAAQRNRGQRQPLKRPHPDPRPPVPVTSAQQPELDDDSLMIEAEEESAVAEDRQDEVSEAHEEGVELDDPLDYTGGVENSDGQPRRADPLAADLPIDAGGSRAADEENGYIDEPHEAADVADFEEREEDQVVGYDAGLEEDEDEEDYNEDPEDDGLIDTYEAENEDDGEIDFAERSEDDGPVDTFEADEDAGEIEFVEHPEDEGPVDTYGAEEGSLVGVAGGTIVQLPDTDDEPIEADQGEGERARAQAEAEAAYREKVRRVFGNPKASSSSRSPYPTADSPATNPKVEPKSSPKRSENPKSFSAYTQALHPPRPARVRSLHGRFNLNLNHPDGLALSTDSVNYMLSRADEARQQSTGVPKGKGKETRRQ